MDRHVAVSAGLTVVVRVFSKGGRQSLLVQAIPAIRTVTTALLRVAGDRLLAGWE